MYQDPSSGIFSGLLQWALLILVIYLLYRILKAPIIVHGNWNHGFPHFQYSPKEFYASVETAVKSHKIPEISFSRVAHFETGLVSARREYLRIQRGAYVFDICAAPFGTGFFVSWWYVERESIIKRLAKRMPILAAMDLTTFYEADTDAMYRAYIHKGLMEAIDDMTNAKGFRTLSELERQPIDVRK